MNDGLVEVNIKHIEAAQMEYAIFLGNDQKTFIIFVGPDVGAAIMLFIQGAAKPRPLTHDLIASIFLGLGVKVEKIVINALKDNTFYARLFLLEQNELGKKYIEVDARPSDSIALALQQNARIFVTQEVFGRVEDVSKYLKKEGSNPSESEDV